MQATTVNTLSYVISTRKGSETTVAERIKKAARRCKEIVSAIPFFPGYVRVEVVGSDECKIKRTRFKMPKNARMVIELVPGVIRVCGNGREAVSLDEQK